MVYAHLKFAVMNSNENQSEQCFIIFHPCSATSATSNNDSEKETFEYEQN